MPGRRTFPDFLCIGAQKAGTSWLNHHLGRQPQLWLPPIKEIHYFDGYRDGLWVRMTGRRASYRIARQRAKKCLTNLGKTGQIELLAWYLRYLMLRRSDSWYISLFPHAGRRIRGEVTPAYAMLDEQTIGHIHTLRPDLKIVYILRDPIQRGWSQFNMNMQKSPGNPTSGTREILEQIGSRRSSLERTGDYIGCLSRWEKYFDRELFHICFFDELAEHPEEFLRDVCLFLGVEREGINYPEDLARPRNQRPHDGVPEHCLPFLSEIFHDQTVRLHKRFNNRYTKSWMENATRARGIRKTCSQVHT